MRNILLLVSLIFSLQVCAEENEYSFNDCKNAYNQKDYASAFQICSTFEKNGDDEIKFDLGYMYVYGYGTTQDYDKAYALFNEVAQFDYPDAWYNLGLMYHFGRGIPKDLNRALGLYEKAAERDIIKAAYNAGKIYLDRTNTNQAKYYLMKAAQGGYNPTFYALGVLYADPKYNSIDYPEAYAWFKLASEDPALHENAMNGLNQVTKHMNPAQITTGNQKANDYKARYFKSIVSD